MKNRRSIQIVCADLDVAQEYCAEFERSGEPFHLPVAHSPAEARLILLHEHTGVILLDESAMQSNESGSLEATVSFLTNAAPVVVVAAPQERADLDFLINSGAVDFVGRIGNFVRVAAGLVERRIRRAAQCAELYASSQSPIEEFAEVFRHELNNPLTGILGNAELLLARRDRLPAAAISRVETIAELAVRLRETVRRLSHACALHGVDPASKANSSSVTRRWRRAEGPSPSRMRPSALRVAAGSQEPVEE